MMMMMVMMMVYRPVSNLCVAVASLAVVDAVFMCVLPQQACAKDAIAKLSAVHKTSLAMFEDLAKDFLEKHGTFVLAVSSFPAELCAVCCAPWARVML